MSKADVWMPFYVNDYLGDTLHLTRDQHGGYLLLLVACWKAGGRLPNNPAELAAIAKATPEEWRRLGPVLKRFFRVDGKWLVHKRVVEELEKAARLSAARKATGSLGGRPKKQNESEPKPIGSANRNQNTKQNETPARVTVTVDVSTAETSQNPSEDSAGREIGSLGAGAPVIPLTGRGRA